MDGNLLNPTCPKAISAAPAVVLYLREMFPHLDERFSCFHHEILELLTGQRNVWVQIHR